jgi:3-deoxy-manno-octulosonate cytidylyltransferase (CMP-KDO synthetase)
LILIPARYASSRFPGKPLAALKGKSMVSRVYEQASALSSWDNIEATACVVTDDLRIEDHLKELGHKVVRVDDDVPSGSERIKLAYDRHFKDQDFDFIVNVQGDEPLLQAKDLEELVSFHQKSSFDICTLVEPKTDFTEFEIPDRVKAAYETSTGQCHYFSRSPIPHDRDKNELKEWYLHVGVYSYRPQALVRFCENPQSELEGIEKLEQLRALGLGMKIGAIKTTHPFMGVDKPEDIEKVEGEIQ